MIGTKHSHGVHQEVIYRTVPGVLRLANIFQFIVDTFDNRSFAEQYFIGLGDIKAFHVFAWLGDQLDAIAPKQASQGL
jgi:presenilin-like A22 family membrane protease